MISRTDLLFSASAIIRALMGKVKGAILRREEWWKVLFVVIALENGRKLCTFVSKKALAALFVADRKARSRALAVSPCVFGGGSFKVRNESKGTVYQVDQWRNAAADRCFRCECEDFKNQQKFIKAKQHACKHIYAVLGYLGYESLSEAIGKEEEPRPIVLAPPDDGRHRSRMLHWSEMLSEDLRPRSSYQVVGYKV